MFDKVKRLFKKGNQEEIDEYVFVTEKEMNEDLKEIILKLERIGEECGTDLQKKYVNKFKLQGKLNLRIWVCRDIDGDEDENLTSEQCFEKEYRSQLVIDYDGPKFEDDFYAYYIPLWYYFGGYFKGSGTLYDLSQKNLETEIDKALKTLLNG
ncbi:MULTISPECIES: hypothetical protein [Priestia]|uniref:hypothetical protein n=1 Tax=Priestia TaxID=2800373 RepID=UPI001293BEFA|nr:MULTISPECIES: hypothetical protein [Priestia]MBY0213545.1 hypothetical protein [Priestia aryabhattai]MQR85915.1 hypothetical protein [Priestia megaterium]